MIAKPALKHFFLGLGLGLSLIIILSSCSIDVSNQALPGTLPVPATQATVTAQVEPPPAVDQSAENTADGARATSARPPTGTAASTSEEAEAAQATAAVPPTAQQTAGAVSISPVDDLSGSLYHLGFTGPRQQSLLRLDLPGGEETSIFVAPENAWLGEVVVSPDGRQLLLAYSPPPQEGEVQFGYTDLYLMPADGSQEPTRLPLEEVPSETYYHISWPEDDLIYFARFGPTLDGSGAMTFSSQIERLHPSNGQREVLVTGGAWPRLSPDGTMLAYVSEEEQFMLAGADGSNPRPILEQETFTAVDAPLFSSDNRLICFSAVLPETASLPSLWDRLLGVRVALAHNVPSDWWCVPLDGSAEPQRLTNLNAIGIYGDFDESGRRLAFITTAGVYVMNRDGSDLLQLSEIPSTGTIDWAP